MCALSKGLQQVCRLRVYTAAVQMRYALYLGARSHSMMVIKLIQATFALAVESLPPFPAPPHLFCLLPFPLFLFLRWAGENHPPAALFEVMLRVGNVCLGQGNKDMPTLAAQLAFDLAVLQGTDDAWWLSVRWPDSSPALNLQLWDPGLIPQVLVGGIDVRPGNRWCVRVSYSSKIVSFLRLQTLWEQVKKKLHWEAECHMVLKMG